MFVNFKNTVRILIGLTCVSGFSMVNCNVQRNYALEFTKGICSHNSSNIKAFECSLRNGSDHQTLIDGRLELAQVIKDFSVRTILQLFQKNKPRMTLFDLTLNGCDLLNTVQRHKILSVYVKTVKKYMNVIPKCPFSKDFNYTLTGFQYDIQDFPSYFPECEFKSTHIIHHQNQESVKILFWGRVVYLKNLKFIG